MGPTSDEKLKPEVKPPEAKKPKRTKRQEFYANLATIIVGFLLFLGIAIKKTFDVLRRDEINQACEIEERTPTSTLIAKLWSLGLTELTPETKGSGIQIFDADNRPVLNWRVDVLSGINEGSILITKVYTDTQERRVCRITFNSGTVQEATFRSVQIGHRISIIR